MSFPPQEVGSPCLSQEVGRLSLPLPEMSMMSHSCFSRGAMHSGTVHRGVVHLLKGKQRLLLVRVVLLYRYCT